MKEGTVVFGIDASRAATEPRTGTEAYAYFLIQALIPAAAERSHQLRLYFNQPRPDLFPAAEHVEIVDIPQQRLWTHSRLRQELQDRPPAVFFTPSHVIPIGYKRPSVATVHDLGYKLFPEAHTRGQRAYLDWSTRHNARSGRRVIADSQTTADDLQTYYDIPAGKIDVIYPGADPTLRPVTDQMAIDAVRASYGIERPYLLYLGTLQPRKNLVRLVEAYAASGVHSPETGQPHSLVLAGKAGWLSGEVTAAIEAQPAEIRRHIHLTGYIGETEKNVLLSGATALAFPSLYEGFGFPVLEAQACDTAVLTSNTSSLPEVAGTAALLVDPLDAEKIAAGLKRLVEDETLRDSLVAAGRENVKRFSWKAAAEAVLDTLEAAAG